MTTFFNVLVRTILYFKNLSAGIYRFKVNIGNTRAICNLFKVNNKDTRMIPMTSSVFLTLNRLNTLLWSFHSFVDFEQLNDSWDV